MAKSRVQYAGAIFDSDGGLLWISTGTNEQMAWQFYLGWPDDEEIKRAKEQGKRFAVVFVTPRQ